MEESKLLLEADLLNTKKESKAIINRKHILSSLPLTALIFLLVNHFHLNPTENGLFIVAMVLIGIVVLIIYLKKPYGGKLKLYEKRIELIYKNNCENFDLKKIEEINVYKSLLEKNNNDDYRYWISFKHEGQIKLFELDINYANSIKIKFEEIILIWEKSTKINKISNMPEIQI